VDRIFTDFPSSVIQEIKSSDYAWFVEGENRDYISDEIMHLTSSEVSALTRAATKAHDLFTIAAEHVITNKLYAEIGIPDNMIELIEYSWNNHHEHLLGRYDIAGGLGGAPAKVLEYNADTATMLVESLHFQDIINDLIGRTKYRGQFNTLESKLVSAFQRLKSNRQGSHPSLLVTSLGYVEDKLNASMIVMAAEKAGWETAYADLEEVHFSDEGVFLELEDGEFVQYDFMYKFVPWEFIAVEEPELMAELTSLVTGGLVQIINPAYSIVLQSKGLLKYVYELDKRSPIVLKTSFEPTDFHNQAYVKKVFFGRLGENMSIHGKDHSIVEQTSGDFGKFGSIYQEFTELYKDDEGYLYQAGVYYVNGSPCCISFRANEKLIMDDDSEFVAHVIS